MIDIDADAVAVGDAVGNGCVGWSIFHMRIMSLASKNHRRIFQRIKSLNKQSQFHKRIQKKMKFLQFISAEINCKDFFPPLISLYYSGLNRLFHTVYGSVDFFAASFNPVFAFVLPIRFGFALNNTNLEIVVDFDQMSLKQTAILLKLNAAEH